jgi:flagellar L-ring protein FlgH
MRNLILAATACALLSGCGAVGRLKSVGKAPRLSATEAVDAPAIEASLADPADRSGRAHAAGPPAAPSASLFRTGAGAFFRDQRAGKIGDILTIRINIADKADIGNTTSRTRDGSETGGIAGLLGLESRIAKITGSDPSTLVDTSSTSDYSGGGSTNRSETINMTMAAIVTQVLPNGNLMIRGRQEVRVNFEMRELIVTGIIRPEDIARDNSIAHSQIAEARVIYGGKGQLTDAQQARWGQQIYDALFPF